MKKLLCLALALMTLALSGCGGKKAEGAGDSMTLDEIAAKIQEGVADLPGVENLPLTDENFQAYAFVEPSAGVEGLASEALISAIAHSVVLLRAQDEAAAKTLAESVKANMNPRKWVCVEAEESIVSVHGTTILLVMSTQAAAKSIAANFDALWA